MTTSTSRKRVGFGLLLHLMLCLSLRAADYYVATNGSDTANSGISVTEPFRTIQRAADGAAAGDTIHIRGGTYREKITITNYGLPGEPITFCAYQHEEPVIKGSDIVGGWQCRTNAIWCLTNWPSVTQQVFDDGECLQLIGPLVNFNDFYEYPVGSNREDMVSGSFFHDPDTSELFVWLGDGSDPNDSVIEVSTRRFLFNGNNANADSYLRLVGLHFMHSNTTNFNVGRTAVLSGGHSIVERCTVEWAHFTGLSLGENARAVDCVLRHNGNKGGSASPGCVFDHCVIVSNNYRRFSHSGTAGGIKSFGHPATVANCEFGWNDGPGMWFDTCNTGDPLIIHDNYFHHNSNAVMIEISSDARIWNNLFRDNMGRDILLSSSQSNHIWNNTFVANRDAYALHMLYSGARSNQLGRPYPLSYNRFFNNIVYDSHGRDIAMHIPDGVNVVDNRSDFNCFYRAHAPPAFAWVHPDRSSALVLGLSNWVASTGWESNSLDVHPGFVNPAGADYHLDMDSPCIDQGVRMPWMFDERDTDGDPWPTGPSPDIGFDEHTSGAPMASGVPRGRAGVFVWSNENAMAVQSVEWASTPGETDWETDWRSLSDLPPRAGARSAKVPVYYRVHSDPVMTNLPGNASALLTDQSGIQTPFDSVDDAYAAASAGDTIFVGPGVHGIDLTIAKSNLTFAGCFKPRYDVNTKRIISGCILDGRTRIDKTRGLRFISLGFQDSAGGNPFACGGTSTDVRDLFMYGCVFAGTGSNAHNVAIVGSNVVLHSCSSFNGGHNFAFKTCRLTLHKIYSYNGIHSGIILKGSSAVGDVFHAELSDIVIEGPVDAATAKGLHIETYDSGARVGHVRVNRLRSRHVNMAVYIWPRAGSEVEDIIVSDAESYDSWQSHGDYVVQGGATRVTFIDCRSHRPAGTSFVNYGSHHVRLLHCMSSLESGSRTWGAFTIGHVNNEFSE